MGITRHLINVSFGIEKGKLIGLLGPSGSGKTTILRMIAGLEQPDSGEIIKQGDVGLVFQNFNLFPHFSVLKNITDAPIRVQNEKERRGLCTGKNSVKADGTCRQRECISVSAFRRPTAACLYCQSIMYESEILFFDEPTSALDPELTSEILKVIKDLAAEHITMVIVTHEMSFARDISDHIIFMDKGLIAVEGSPKEVFESEHARMKEFLGKFHQG